MRGRRNAQATMLAFVDLVERVPKDHSIVRGLGMSRRRRSI